MYGDGRCRARSSDRDQRCYDSLLSISQGASLSPDSADPHNVVLRASLAVNKESAWVRTAQGYASLATGGKADLDPLGWLGESISVYADDSPVWDELAAPSSEGCVTLHDLWKGRLAHVLKLPVGVHFEVSSGMELTTFLLALQEFAYANFGLTFNDRSLRVIISLDRSH